MANSSVRTQAQIDSIIKQHPKYASKISGVVVPVIEAPGAYDEVVKTVDGIIHAASPVVFNAADPQDVIRPAVEGATGILKSAAKYGKNVKRVVLTSSSVAVAAEAQKVGDVYDEVSLSIYPSPPVPALIGVFLRITDCLEHDLGGYRREGGRQGERLLGVLCIQDAR